MERPNDTVHWLSEDEYRKVIWDLRKNVSMVLHPLRMYGQNEFVDQAIIEIMKLCEAYGLRVRGIEMDQPINIETIRRKIYANS